MATEDCPLPEVAEALSPFIKPRDEVANIRRGLQSYVQSHLRTDGGSLSPINLAIPNASQFDPPPAGLPGVRKGYWKALQAHDTAQAKYDALKLQLGQLKRNKAGPSSKVDSQNPPLVDEGYITLLRQREKHRKLKVVDRALSEITSAGSDVSVSNLDDTVKKKIGELPSPPSTQPSFSQSPEVEAKVMELKKSVVSTKRRVEELRSRAVAHPTNGTSKMMPQGEVAGLQKALQELTSWMETQLTLIANAEAEVHSAERPATNGTPARSLVSIEDIEALYEQYLEARQRLIQNVNESSAADSDQSTAGLDWEPSSSKSVNTSMILTE